MLLSMRDTPPNPYPFFFTEYASPPGGFSRSSSMSINRSPDTASPIYPERAIRPLPKSKLKSKLSPEQAGAIVFPPDPPPVNPTLNFQQDNAGSGNQQQQSTRMTNGHDVAHGHYLHHHPHTHADAPVHNHCTCGEDGDSGDEEVEFDHPDYRYAVPTANGATPGQGEGRVLDNVQRRLMEAARIPTKPPPPGSTASSADGYESFENTSNKKKRKIPLSSASSMHQSQLSAEMASMGISGSIDGAADDVGGPVGVQHQHYVQNTPYTPSPAVTANAGTGISGAGRGRYGRQNARSDHAMRRPLGTSSLNSVNGYSGRMAARSGSEVKNAADAGIENTGGIISQAIKTAAEQGPLTPQRGQENTSLLQSATSNSSSTPANAKTQFTFTMESESATKMVDQQVAAAAAGYGTPTPNTRGVNGTAVHGTGGKGMSTQGTQTTPSLRGNPPNGGGGGGGGNNSRLPPNAPPPPAGQQPAAQPLPPKPRRRPSKEFALAARQRRLQQEYTNYHHRPTKDNMWICEFCEYEDIFGVPPVALIRQYEVKDRQDRKRQAEKRRLLEKAKAKGRKGKKGGKKNNNVNNGNAALNNAGMGGGQQQHHYDPNMPPPQPGEEEFFDDEGEYADEYDPVGGGGLEDERYEPGPGYYQPPPPPPVQNDARAGGAAGMGAGVGGGGGKRPG
ncbi:hypothetical protein LTR37_004064 [Vermiconidia calcicola]|uniref:Uncharacterized protein n=1 Tax=Vermiconidia calcicola TaxID=1690605 RepID=A0ACC3NP33_9PEZI|nr:hypothetical protein LTR37_004064 [Vermiconidia calcicola]